MAKLQSTTISGSISNTGSLQITGSTLIPPLIESSLTSSFTASGLLWVNADNLNLQYTTQTSRGTIQSPASFMGAFSVGPGLPTCVMNLGRAGTQNSALAFGGSSSYPSNFKSCNQTYDGTSWSAGGTLITGRGGIGAGNSSASDAIGFGGFSNSSLACTEEYNGSAWATGGALGIARRFQGGTGAQNSALSVGGDYATTSAEHYNGSTWSSGTSLIKPRTSLGLTGTQNAALAATGYQSAPVSEESNFVELYDGITWQGGNCTNIARLYANHAMAGDQNEAVIISGGPSTSLNSEEWNGLTWAMGCTPNITRRSAGVAGSNSNLGTGDAIMMGGTNAPYSSNVGSRCVELYTKNDILPYTTSVWSSGAGNILAKSGAKGAGDANAALSFGGTISPARVSCTEEYDGTSWTAGGAMINAVGNHGGTGTANAALSAGGEPATCCKAEEYNGTTWASGGNLSQGGYGNATLGSQNDALNFGGNFTGKKAETYNGTAWSTITDMSCCRRSAIAGAGTSNSSIVFGGRCYTAPTTCHLTCTEEWDGSSWSFGGAITTARSNGIGGGQTVGTALATGGYNPGSPNGTIITELYDGTSWSAGANAIDCVKYSAGSSIGASAFSTQGLPQNSKSQFYEAFCSTTMCSAIGTWSAAASMINSRYSLGYSPSGTQNSALASGGYPGSSPLTATEEYNGTAWAAGGALTEGKWLGGSAGTQNANLFVAGANPTNHQTNAQEYDGSSWSNITAFPTGKNALSGTGTEPAALFMGGTNPSVQSGTTEWNGSAWSAGGSLITARRYGGASGTQNAGLYSVGDTLPAKRTCVEEYDGSSWATGGTAINAVNQVTSGGCQYNAFVIGGVGGKGETQLYNGAAWEIGFPLPKNTNNGGASGTQTNTIFYGGYNPSTVNLSYEFNCTTTGNKVGVWATGGNLINSIYAMGGAGTTNAGLVFGGLTPSVVSCTEEYNGSSWAVGGALITARRDIGGSGTQDAALAAGGMTPTKVTCTEEYDGSSWSTGGNLIQARDGSKSAGTQNATVTAGGRCVAAPAGGGTTCTEEYDGSSWSAGGALSCASYARPVAGTQNSAIAVGGFTGTTAPTAGCACTNTELYNGSSWSTGPDALVCRAGGNISSTGVVNEVRLTGGMEADSGPYKCIPGTELYNGIAWSKDVSIPTIAGSRSDFGTGPSFIVTGGYNGSEMNRTDEFTCTTVPGAGLTTQRTEVTLS